MSIEYEPEVIDQKKSPLKSQNEEKITFEVDLSTGKSFKTFDYETFKRGYEKNKIALLS